MPRLKKAATFKIVPNKKPSFRDPPAQRHIVTAAQMATKIATTHEATMPSPASDALLFCEHEEANFVSKQGGKAYAFVPGGVP